MVLSAPTVRQENQHASLENSLCDVIPQLLRRAKYLTRNVDDAWDLVQRTLERAVEAGASFQARGLLLGWLQKVQYHLFVDEMRHRKQSEGIYREFSLTQVELEDGDTDTAWDTLEPGELAQMIQRLEPELRIVTELRLSQNSSLRDMASELGVPSATVGTRLFRARQKLKEQVMGLID